MKTLKENHMQTSSFLKIEFRKMKRTFLSKFIVLVPLAMFVLLLLDIWIRYGLTSTNLNWETLIKENTGPLMWVHFLPVFASIIAMMVYQIEHNDNGLKMMFSLPIKREKIYLAKTVVILFCTSVMILLNLIGVILVGIIVGIETNFPYNTFAIYMISQVVCIFGVITIQNWLSSYFSNILLPVFIAFAGMIFAFALPYEFPFIGKFVVYSQVVFSHLLRGFNPLDGMVYSLVIGLIVYIFGTLEFKYREVG